MVSENPISESLRSKATALAQQSAALLDREDLAEKPKSFALAITNGTAALVISALADTVSGTTLEKHIQDATDRNRKLSKYFNALRTAQAKAVQTNDWTDYDTLTQLGLAGFEAAPGPEDPGAGTSGPAS